MEWKFKFWPSLLHKKKKQHLFHYRSMTIITSGVIFELSFSLSFKFGSGNTVSFHSDNPRHVRTSETENEDCIELFIATTQ